VTWPHARRPSKPSIRLGRALTHAPLIDLRSLEFRGRQQSAVLSPALRSSIWRTPASGAMEDTMVGALLLPPPLPPASLSEACRRCPEEKQRRGLWTWRKVRKTTRLCRDQTGVKT
jgi:hypothetical protein